MTEDYLMITGFWGVLAVRVIFYIFSLASNTAAAQKQPLTG